MIEQLSLIDEESLHHSYRRNDLFRHWSPILSRLERENDEINPCVLWSLAVKFIQRLRDEKEYRDELVDLEYNHLIKESYVVLLQSKTYFQRSGQLAERTAITVMCIVLTLLMNAVEKGKEDESFNNRPICLAIVTMLCGHPYFVDLMDTFFKKKIDNNGKEIEFKPCDPLIEGFDIDNMDETAKTERDEMLEFITNHAQPIQSMITPQWDSFVEVWRQILLLPNFLRKMREENPRKSQWGINVKMFCNVLGIFHDICNNSVSVVRLDRILFARSQKSYISNHSYNAGSDTTLTKEEHQQIEQIIRNCLSN